MAFVAMPFALRLGTKIPSRLFLKDAYRFARSFHCPSPEGAVRRVDSSHGVHRVCPFADISTARPLPLAETSFGGKVPPFPHVPSLPFLPASTVSSARRPASLLHLAADRGVRPVSGPGAEARRAVPVGGTPFEAFPSPAASSRHRCAPEGVRCTPRVVPSRRCSWLPRRLRVATRVVCRPGPRPQGFAPPKSPLQTIGVATSRRPMLPWAYWSDTVRGSRTVAGQRAAGRSTPEGGERSDRAPEGAWSRLARPEGRDIAARGLQPCTEVRGPVTVDACERRAARGRWSEQGPSCQRPAASCGSMTTGRVGCTLGCAVAVGRMSPSGRSGHWTCIGWRRWPMPMDAGRSLCPRAVAAAVSAGAGRSLCSRTGPVRVSVDRGPTPRGRSGWPGGCDACCPEGRQVGRQSA